jgi:hypothetical protein
MKPISPVITKYLQSVKEEVAKLTDPKTGKPVEIPNFTEILDAAGKLDTTKHPVEFMSIIRALLGRAKSVGFDTVEPDYKVSFPADHHMHPGMGDEWYWIACHADVTDQNGNKGRLSVMTVMEKFRCIGVEAQKEAGWSDMDAAIVTNISTVTVDMGPDDRKYYRRADNFQWTLKDGSAGYSAPGENFSFQCGDDSFTGSENVLPLNVRINDGDNLKTDITFTNREPFKVEDSFFLQGIPNLHIGGTGGTGITPIPTPGIYYSWPQLFVSGTVTVGGNTYTINSGSGWIDHQLMMTSLENPKGAASPVPFIDDFSPFNGWTWQYFNLNNGEAFTGSSFVLGKMENRLSFPYGYIISPHNGKWKAHYITGESSNLYPLSYPSIVNSPESSKVVIPIFRTFENLKSLFGHHLSGAAAPWNDIGTFNGPDKAVASEIPADFADMSGNFADGVGYLESVGFQNVNDYREYALAFLKSGE